MAIVDGLASDPEHGLPDERGTASDEDDGREDDGYDVGERSDDPDPMPSKVKHIKTLLLLYVTTPASVSSSTDTSPLSRRLDSVQPLRD